MENWIQSGCSNFKVIHLLAWGGRGGNNWNCGRYCKEPVGPDVKSRAVRKSGYLAQHAKPPYNDRSSTPTANDTHSPPTLH